MPDRKWLFLPISTSIKNYNPRNTHVCLWLKFLLSLNLAKNSIFVQTLNNVQRMDEGTVIVCDMTTPDFVPYLKKCVAIVTDRGGILSHAAIISRELNLPCVVATNNSTTILEDGMRVQVNADEGIIEVIS